jgi:hypothetical protein
MSSDITTRPCDEFSSRPATCIHDESRIYFTLLCMITFQLLDNNPVILVLTTRSPHNIQPPCLP